jgi:hypothetical protein
MTTLSAIPTLAADRSSSRHRLPTMLLAMPTWLACLGTVASFEALLWGVSTNDVPVIGGAVTVFLTAIGTLYFKAQNDRRESARADRREDRDDKRQAFEQDHNVLGQEVAALRIQAELNKTAIAALQSENVLLKAAQLATGQKADASTLASTAGIASNDRRITRVEDKADRKDVADHLRDATADAKPA